MPFSSVLFLWRLLLIQRYRENSPWSKRRIASKHGYIWYGKILRLFTVLTWNSHKQDRRDYLHWRCEKRLIYYYQKAHSLWILLLRLFIPHALCFLLTQLLLAQLYCQYDLLSLFFFSLPTSFRTISGQFHKNFDCCCKVDITAIWQLFAGLGEMSWWSQLISSQAGVHNSKHHLCWHRDSQPTKIKVQAHHGVKCMLKGNTTWNALGRKAELCRWIQN